MKTQISTKLAALGFALMVNGALIGGVAILFNGQLHHSALSVLVHTGVAAAASVV